MKITISEMKNTLGWINRFYIGEEKVSGLEDLVKRNYTKGKAKKKKTVKTKNVRK